MRLAPRASAGYLAAAAATAARTGVAMATAAMAASAARAVTAAMPAQVRPSAASWVWAQGGAVYIGNALRHLVNPFTQVVFTSNVAQAGTGRLRRAPAALPGASAGAGRRRRQLGGNSPGPGPGPGLTSDGNGGDGRRRRQRRHGQFRRRGWPSGAEAEGGAIYSSTTTLGDSDHSELRTPSRSISLRAASAARAARAAPAETARTAGFGGLALNGGVGPRWPSTLGGNGGNGGGNGGDAGIGGNGANGGLAQGGAVWGATITGVSSTSFSNNTASRRDRWLRAAAGGYVGGSGAPGQRRRLRVVSAEMANGKAFRPRSVAAAAPAATRVAPPTPAETGQARRAGAEAGPIYSGDICRQHRGLLAFAHEQRALAGFLGGNGGIGVQWRQRRRRGRQRQYTACAARQRRRRRRLCWSGRCRPDAGGAANFGGLAQGGAIYSTVLLGGITADLASAATKAVAGAGGGGRSWRAA